MKGSALVPGLAAKEPPWIVWIRDQQQTVLRGRACPAPRAHLLALPGSMTSDGRLVCLDAPRSLWICVGTVLSNRFSFSVETFNDLGASYGNWGSEF